MKSFKFIVLLFGISSSNNSSIIISCINKNSCSDLNLSKSFTYNCSLNDIKYYENTSSIINYRHKEQKKVYIVNNIVNNIVIFIVCASLTFSVVFVSNYVYSTMVNQFAINYNANKVTYNYDPYLFDYLDDFSNMKSCVLQ